MTINDNLPPYPVIDLVLQQERALLKHKNVKATKVRMSPDVLFRARQDTYLIGYQNGREISFNGLLIELASGYGILEVL